VIPLECNATKPERLLVQLNISSVPPSVWGMGCVLVCVGGFVYYWFGPSGATKRRTFPWFMGACGVLWVGVAWVSPQVSPEDFLPTTLLIGVIMIANIASVTFCEQCAYMFRRGLFRRLRSCPRCGAPFVSTGPQDGSMKAPRSD
jgi:hypothetical protein